MPAPLSKEPLPPEGDPDSITCRHCQRVRSIRRVGDTTYRQCRTCDVPDPKQAKTGSRTWADTKDWR